MCKSFSVSSIAVMSASNLSNTYAKALPHPFYPYPHSHLTQARIPHTTTHTHTSSPPPAQAAKKELSGAGGSEGPSRLRMSAEVANALRDAMRSSGHLPATLQEDQAEHKGAGQPGSPSAQARASLSAPGADLKASYMAALDKVGAGCINAVDDHTPTPERRW